MLRDERHIYIMFDSFSLLSLGAVVREVFDVKNVLVWDKVNLGMGHYFRRRHEHVIFATKGHRRLSRRDLPDVWSVKRLTRAPYPTQKPVALFERMLAGSAEPGFVVCDPFVGSGSAAIAALRNGCSFVGCGHRPARRGDGARAMCRLPGRGRSTPWSPETGGSRADQSCLVDVVLDGQHQRVLEVVQRVHPVRDGTSRSGRRTIGCSSSATRRYTFPVSSRGTSGSSARLRSSNSLRSSSMYRMRLRRA